MTDIWKLAGLIYLFGIFSAFGLACAASENDWGDGNEARTRRRFARIPLWPLVVLAAIIEEIPNIIRFKGVED